MSGQNASETRLIEEVLDIQASPEEVWKALTDADELTNWFPLEARVVPGFGGSIWTSFRDTCDFEGESRIEIWEPKHHLRLVHPPGLFAPDLSPSQSAKEKRVPARSATADEAASVETSDKPKLVHMATDYILEAKSGGTTLRLVHSGFGTEANWDDLYNSTARGWIFQLRGLRHYLERHRGIKRTVVSSSRRIATKTQQEAWNLVTGPQRLHLVITGATRYSLELRPGDVLSGKIWGHKPPHDFFATVANLNDALLRISVEPAFLPDESGVVQIWMSTYGLPEKVTDELQRETDLILGDFI